MPDLIHCANIFRSFFFKLNLSDGSDIRSTNAFMIEPSIQFERRIDMIDRDNNNNNVVCFNNGKSSFVHSINQLRNVNEK